MLWKKSLFVILLCVALLLNFLPVNGAAVTVEVSSRSGVLLEVATGRILWQKQAHEPLPMASTTKLMTALLAAEELDWDATITVPPEAVLVEGSALGLRGGDALTVEDLVTGMLLASGNDAANTVAMVVSGSLAAFAQRMNQRAAVLGMEDTLMVTPSGLDEGGHHSSAYDMALLAVAVLQNDRLAAICAQKSATITINGVEVTVTNHNRLLSLYADCIGMKTGYTRQAGRCLVSAARRNGMTLVAVTLNGGDYWNDHIRLYEAGFSLAEESILSCPPLPALPVSGGTQSSVALAAEPVTVTWSAGTAEDAVARLVIPSFVWAPVEAGMTVGQVIWYVDNRPVATAAIATTASCEARPVAGFGKQMWRRFLALLGWLAAGPS